MYGTLMAERERKSSGVEDKGKLPAQSELTQFRTAYDNTLRKKGRKQAG